MISFWPRLEHQGRVLEVWALWTPNLGRLHLPDWFRRVRGGREVATASGREDERWMYKQAVKGSGGPSGSKRADDGRGFELQGFRAATLSTHFEAPRTWTTGREGVEVCDVKEDDLCSRCGRVRKQQTGPWL